LRPDRSVAVEARLFAPKQFQAQPAVFLVVGGEKAAAIEFERNEAREASAAQQS
jgi:hypothetical protein